jgi:hypothetical protein
MNRIAGIRLAVFLIALVVGFASLHWRTSAILDTTDQLIDDANELLRVVKGIRDGSSAKAAQAEVVKLAGKMKAGEDKFEAKRQEVNRNGGVTENGVAAVDKKIDQYKSIVVQIEHEIERIALMPNLPPDFLSSLQAAVGVSSGQVAQNESPFVPEPAQPAIPTSFGDLRRHMGREMPAGPSMGPRPGAESRPHNRSIGGGSQVGGYGELIERFGRDKVVRVIVVNYAAIAAQIDKVAKEISNAAPEMVSCEMTGPQVLLAPVNDFDAFCKRLSFAEIGMRDDAQKIVTIKVELTRFGAPPSQSADRAPEHFGDPNRDIVSSLLGQYGAARPDASDHSSASSSSREPDTGSKTPESEQLKNLRPGVLSRSDPATSEANPFTEQGTGSPTSDEQQREYSRLAEAINSDETLIRQDAVSALLKVKPSDVADPKTRKAIARGYKNVATGSDPFQAAKAVQGLVIWGGKYSVPILVEVMEKDTRGMLEEVYGALVELKDPKGAAALTEQLVNSSKREKVSDAIKQMGEVGEDALINAISSNNSDVAIEAVKLLGKIGTQRCLALLTTASDSPNDDIRGAAADAKSAVEKRIKTTSD